MQRNTVKNTILTYVCFRIVAQDRREVLWVFLILYCSFHKCRNTNSPIHCKYSPIPLPYCKQTHTKLQQVMCIKHASYYCLNISETQRHYAFHMKRSTFVCFYYHFMILVFWISFRCRDSTMIYSLENEIYFNSSFSGLEMLFPNNWTWYTNIHYYTFYTVTENSD